MLADALTSFKDNVRRRLTNPFLGTFTAVYLIKNWELFYGILYFDNTATQESRINFVRDYYGKIDGISNLAITILITFAVLLSTYMLLGISRLFANLYEDYALPLINKLTGNSRNVTREVYSALLNSRNDLESRYEQERAERNRIQDERDKLEKALVDLKTSDKSMAELANLQAMIESLNSQLSAKNSEIDSLKKQTNDKDLVINKLEIDLSQRREPKIIKTRELSLHEMLYKQLQERNLLKTFDDLFIKSRTQEYTNYDKNNVMFFLENNIITLGRTNNFGMTTIDFTSVGLDIYNLRIRDKLKVEKHNKEQVIYEKIIERFPAGRLAAHLLNSNNIDKKEVIQELSYIAKGLDSDRRYTDKQSQVDATDFINMLENI